MRQIRTILRSVRYMDAHAFMGVMAIFTIFMFKVL
jgi:hypothetical protein